MADTELKPCPFCGKRVAVAGTIAEIDCLDDDENSFENTHYIVCCNVNKGGCGSATGVFWETKEAAIEAWNRRKEDDKL